MKEIIQVSNHQIILLLTAFVIYLSACDNDDDPQTVPVVATLGTTDVSSTTAMGGGVIESDGNSKIVSSGLCWSSTNSVPTVSDDTTNLIVTTGDFTSLMKGLVPSTTYRVRAYATNSVGTGYGEVITFTTGNASPTATDLHVSGTVRVLETLIASYEYDDAEDDAEGASTFQWYIANDETGAGETAIDGANELTYTLKNSDEFKFIRFGIKPVAISGSMLGTEVKSSFVGPVAEEPTIITFTYNNSSVTYGIVISSVTGRRWMDRNLGAPNAPSAYNDYSNLGDLFQWGRRADGHQLLLRTPDATTPGLGTTSAVNGTTTGTLATSDTPSDNKFIIPAASPYDWRDPQNNNLWSGIDKINNPCPEGWHIPSREEWAAEQLSADDRQANYSQMSLTNSGYRSGATGSFRSTTSSGYYWTSSTFGELAYKLISTDGLLDIVGEYRTQGAACRCIKDKE